VAIGNSFHITFEKPLGISTMGKSFWDKVIRSIKNQYQQEQYCSLQMFLGTFNEPQTIWDVVVKSTI
jgi:hypothetical protein